jgi:xanthine dehydrogenase YagS FAD-binding subunit
MRPFRYAKASDAAGAVQFFAQGAQAKYLGGGTNLVDLMRENIERPEIVIDVTGLSREIRDNEDGGLVIDAGTKNTAVASHRAVRERYPVLAQAILAGASAQIRNMATVGGNLMQRTRCYYFYDDAARCNKRERGTGCDAVEGFNRIHAILGASSHCIATHPSDMCVALAALDAVVHLEGPQGRRDLKLVDLHRLPGDTPDIETELRAGELIAAVGIPVLPFAMRSSYRKVRDRSSFAFALVSVAAALDVDDKGNVRNVRLALGGVAHKPWRATAAEKVLQGAPASEENFRRAAEAELKDAVGLAGNAFKIDLAKRVIVNSLQKLAIQPGAGS